MYCRKPSGCGEQTMITAGPNTYVHFYLVSTKKMVEGSPKHTQSIEFMKSGTFRDVSLLAGMSTICAINYN